MDKASLRMEGQVLAFSLHQKVAQIGVIKTIFEYRPLPSKDRDLLLMAARGYLLWDYRLVSGQNPSFVRSPLTQKAEAFTRLDK